MKKLKILGIGSVVHRPNLNLPHITDTKKVKIASHLFETTSDGKLFKAYFGSVSLCSSRLITLDLTDALDGWTPINIIFCFDPEPCGNSL